ncbi:MAG: hypothetical protein CSA83_01200 [Actinomycetales bacterium]|nr:MAG: hypothetical protein CSA83_01200 [Actinomycetales bacterium]
MLNVVSLEYNNGQMPPAGWYPDPAGSANERYWDGASWSASIREASQVTGQLPYGYSVQQPIWQTGPNYAHWGWRVGAYLLDTILISIVGSLLFLPWRDAEQAAMSRWQEQLESWIKAGSTGPIPMPWEDPEYLKIFFIQLGISWAVFMLYTVTMLSLKGATLGKMALGLKVVPSDDLGAEKLGAGTAFARSIAFLLLGLVPIINLIYLLTPLWRPKRQGWHDSMAKTVVLKIR